MAWGARSRVGSILRVESLQPLDSVNLRFQMQPVERMLRVETCESFDMQSKCLCCRFCWSCLSLRSTADQTIPPLLRLSSCRAGKTCPPGRVADSRLCHSC